MKPVHTYIELVQCPQCRDTFMALGDDCCWRCAPEGPPPTHAELAAARLNRVGAEIAEGSPGSLAGLGFAPLGSAPVVFGPPQPLRVPTPPGDEPERLPRAEPSDPLAIPRWAAVIGWLLLMIHAVQVILRQHPLIGPK
ncbi:MAG TPA: hypothetical protein VGM51_04930 [Armatimonadota bacterium]